MAPQAKRHLHCSHCHCSTKSAPQPNMSRNVLRCAVIQHLVVIQQASRQRQQQTGSDGQCPRLQCCMACRSGNAGSKRIHSSDQRGSAMFIEAHQYCEACLAAPASYRCALQLGLHDISGTFCECRDVRAVCSLQQHVSSQCSQKKTGNTLSGSGATQCLDALLCATSAESESCAYFAVRI